MNEVPGRTSKSAAPPSGRRTAIITGGSRSIGAGLVAGFRNSGCAVVAISRSIGSADEGDLLTIRRDITDEQTARKMVDVSLDRFGRIDCLVNDAGVFIGKPFMDYTRDDYELVTSVNLSGFFYLSQRVIGQMVLQGTGHVVNVTTSLVDKADSRTPAALTALTKGGLAAVTRSLAIEYASHGVRVNAVALGVIQTTDDDASFAGMAELHPLGRLGQIDDVVDSVLYLERASFVTGEILHIDGGQAAGSMTNYRLEQSSGAESPGMAPRL
jgi:NAD(P)-dependent dehydrogenase (short-subunit alcohol dehydrogenase family)